MDDPQNKSGGTAWELGEAERLMRDAQTPEDRALAMQRYAEAMRNMLMGTLAPSFERAMTSVIDRKDAEKQNSIRAMLRDELLEQTVTQANRHDELKGIVNARYDALGGELDKIHDTLGEVASRQGKQQDQIDAHSGILSDHAELLEQQSADIDITQQDVAGLKKNVELLTVEQKRQGEEQKRQGERLQRVERIVQLVAEHTGAAMAAAELLDPPTGGGERA